MNLPESEKHSKKLNLNNKVLEKFNIINEIKSCIVL